MRQKAIKWKSISGIITQLNDVYNICEFTLWKPCNILTSNSYNNNNRKRFINNLNKNKREKFYSLIIHWTKKIHNKYLQYTIKYLNKHRKDKRNNINISTILLIYEFVRFCINIFLSAKYNINASNSWNKECEYDGKNILY